MPTVRLLPQDLTRVRFAHSPLWETIGTLWNSAGAFGSPPWLNVESAKDDVPTVRALLRARRYVPDFLTPPPATSGEFGDNLSLLERTPHATVRANLEAYGHQLGGDVEAVVEEGLRDPQRLLEDVSREVRTYWQRTLAPAWPRLRAILEGDVLLRGRSLAVDGPDVAFAHLHALLKFEGTVLHVKQAGETVDSSGHGLVFMPTVFHASPCYLIGEEQPFVVTYAARGGAALWQKVSETPTNALELLMGHTRARMLYALRAPVSNRALAVALDVTPAAVSQHLAVLRRAELVRQHRVGRTVYFLLSERGEALLGVFAAAPPHLPLHPDASTLTA